MLALRAGLVLLSALVLQLEFFSEMRISGVSAELLLALAVAAGLTGGAERGAIFGFIAGLAMDLYLPTPFGLSAVAYAVAGAGVGLAQDSVMERSLLTLVGFPALGTAVGLVSYVIGAVALGYGEVYRDDLGRVLVTVVLINGLLGFVLVPLTHWMWDTHWNREPLRRAV